MLSENSPVVHRNVMAIKITRSTAPGFPQHSQQLGHKSTDLYMYMME